MKKKALLCVLLCAMLLQSIGLAGCGKKTEKYTTYSFDYFDTVTTITGYADSQKAFDEVAGEILEELGEYHKLFTIYHRYDGMENLCTVNETVNGAHRRVTVDPRIAEMLLYAKDMYEKTDGTVNVAMGSVLSIWHDYRTEGVEEPWAAKLPETDELQEAAAHTDIHKLEIDEAACTVMLTDPDMKLDVGAIAKGYAVEMAARSLEEKGISGYVINVGGNVRTVGPKGDGTPWTVGIENPEEDSEKGYLAYLELSGESLVTSGSYQRYYVVDGKRYHHIIDPETLFPSEGYVSVSVVTKSSADGDALSTALFCMDFEEGLNLVESLEGVEAMWLLPDGTKKESSGFANYKKETME
ncbi:MAG: FAD:protein FMN transferase [Lachnospiraceae bacterium]|nr:FAD:protein FMN transferase [Lachnospiraceae bacterium]